MSKAGRANNRREICQVNVVLCFHINFSRQFGFDNNKLGSDGIIACCSKPNLRSHQRHEHGQLKLEKLGQSNAEKTAKKVVL